MNVRIMCNHPIATRSPPECWDGKVHSCDASLLDVKTLGAWLTKRVGFRFNYRPGHSRLSGGKCVFFPSRRKAGIHAMWVEEVSCD